MDAFLRSDALNAVTEVEAGWGGFLAAGGLGGIALTRGAFSMGAPVLARLARAVKTAATTMITINSAAPPTLIPMIKGIERPLLEGGGEEVVANDPVTKPVALYLARKGGLKTVVRLLRSEETC